MPLMPSHASWGPIVPPVRVAVLVIDLISSFDPMIAPPRRSLWPPMYLVQLSTTRSAPSSRGLWKYGEANVLSTTTSVELSLAMRLISLISQMDIVGLAGDSRKIILGWLDSADSTSRRFVVSTNSATMPSLVARDEKSP